MKRRIIRGVAAARHRSPAAAPAMARRLLDRPVRAHVKVDEDLPRQIADMLNARGYEATTVVDQGLQGSPDDELWQHVQHERRWLITADKGFGDLRTYPPGSHAGILLLRSREESRNAYLELAEAALDQLEFDKMPGAIVVVTESGIRIRRAR